MDMVLYSLIMKKVNKLASGISSITVQEESGKVYLVITFSSGTQSKTEINGILTKQQRDDLVKAIPILNKMLEKNGRLTYDSKKLLTEADLSDSQIQSIIKLLDAIKIDTDNKVIVNDVKIEKDTNNNILVNGQKINFIDDTLTTSNIKTYSIDKIISLLKEKQKKIYFEEPSTNVVLENNDIWIDNKDGKLTLKVYDLNNTKWNEISGSSEFELKEWVSGNNYLKNEYVVYDYKLYQVTENINGETTFDKSKYKLIIGDNKIVTDYSKLPSRIDNDIYYCLNDYTDTSETPSVVYPKGFYLYNFTLSKWELINNNNDNNFKFNEWVTKENHEKDKYYLYNHKLYECLEDNNDEIFEETKYKLLIGENDYNNLINIPTINNVELKGDKTLDDLNVQEKIEDRTTEIDIPSTWITE